MCQTIPEEECHPYPAQQCHVVPREECHTVPREYCFNVPKEHCQTVPIQVGISRFLYISWLGQFLSLLRQLVQVSKRWI